MPKKLPRNRQQPRPPTKQYYPLNPQQPASVFNAADPSLPSPPPPSIASSSASSKSPPNSGFALKRPRHQQEFYHCKNLWPVRLSIKEDNRPLYQYMLHEAETIGATDLMTLLDKAITLYDDKKYLELSQCFEQLLNYLVKNYYVATIDQLIEAAYSEDYASVWTLLKDFPPNWRPCVIEVLGLVTTTLQRGYSIADAYYNSCYGVEYLQRYSGSYIYHLVLALLKTIEAPVA